MRKRNIVLSLFPICLASAACVSCSNDYIGPTITSKSLSGGSLVITGNDTGSDTNYWKVFVNNKNLSLNASWKLTTPTENIFYIFNRTELGAQICWKDLSFGIYEVVLHSYLTINNQIVELESQKIHINIITTSPVTGGSLSISSTSTYRDSKAWHFYYNGIDYAQNAKWSINFISNPNKNIKIEYLEREKGAILSWNGLPIGIYKFLIQAEASDDSNETYVFFSDPVTLEIYDNKDQVEIRGGNQYITLQHDQQGVDTKEIIVWLNSIEDITEIANFSIISSEKIIQEKFNIVRSDDHYYIHWFNDVPLGIHTFKIGVLWKEQLYESELTYTINSIEKGVNYEK